MIIRKNQSPVIQESYGDNHRLENHPISETGGLTQFGAYLNILQPGMRSADRHWHEEEDEFLYVVSGQVTVVEDDGEHVLEAGDAACWPAGIANAHHVINTSEHPCAFLIVGTRATDDICHYPDLGRALHTTGDTWRLISEDGTVLRQGTR